MKFPVDATAFIDVLDYLVFLFFFCTCSEPLKLIALWGQLLIQIPQAMHSSGLTNAGPRLKKPNFSCEMAFSGQERREGHIGERSHFEGSIYAALLTTSTPIYFCIDIPYGGMRV